MGFGWTVNSEVQLQPHSNLSRSLRVSIDRAGITLPALLPRLQAGHQGLRAGWSPDEEPLSVLGVILPQSLIPKHQESSE